MTFSILATLNVPWLEEKKDSCHTISSCFFKSKLCNFCALEAPNRSAIIFFKSGTVLQSIIIGQTNKYIRPKLTPLAEPMCWAAFDVQTNSEQ